MPVSYWLWTSILILQVTRRWNWHHRDKQEPGKWRERFTEEEEAENLATATQVASPGLRLRKARGVSPEETGRTPGWAAAPQQSSKPRDQWQRAWTAGEHRPYTKLPSFKRIRCKWYSKRLLWLILSWNYVAKFMPRKHSFSLTKSCILTGRTDAEAETPVLLSPDAKNPTHWKWSCCLERLKVGREGDDRGWWDGCTASPMWWTWVWIGSRSWWWTGKPRVLQFMGSQRARPNWVTELNWTGIETFQIYHSPQGFNMPPIYLFSKPYWTSKYRQQWNLNSR